MKTITYKGTTLTLVHEPGNRTIGYVGPLFTDGYIIVKFDYWHQLIISENVLEITEIKLMAGDIRALSAYYAREAAKEVV